MTAHKPRKIRPDPAGAKSIERLYMRELNTLVVNFGQECRKIIDPQSIIRALESPPLDPSAIARAIRQAAEQQIAVPGERVALKASNLAFRQGKRFAEREIDYLNRIPVAKGSVSISLGGGLSPAELKTMKAIYERNLIEIKGMSDDLAKRMMRELLDGMEKGENPRVVARRISTVTDIGKKRAVTIARTETMRAVNTSTKERIRAQGFSSVEWVSAQDDGRTCDECLELNGQIFPIDNVPVAHGGTGINCRCTVVPTMTDEEAAAMDAEG
jgi:SPP1 gp7 family putative phage head morphogenesis protein